VAVERRAQGTVGERLGGLVLLGAIGGEFGVGRVVVRLGDGAVFVELRDPVEVRLDREYADALAQARARMVPRRTTSPSWRFRGRPSTPFTWVIWSMYPLTLNATSTCALGRMLAV